MTLSAWWAIAQRDLSVRFRGLRLLVVCLFLGVAAIAAIGTLTSAIDGELKSRGRTILGGDVQVEVWQREATADEMAAFSALGRVSGGLRLQAMASKGDLAAPVELKAVDAAWPLVGRLTLSDGRKVGAPAAGMVWLSRDAAARLGAEKGQTVTIGGQPLQVGEIISDEPDRLSEGFTLGPAAIVAQGFPASAGLTQPGAMYRARYRILLSDPVQAVAAIDELKARFPTAGFTYRRADRAAPGAEQFVSRMGEFLVLVGLAALAIAGIGIGGGVSSYLEARRGSIATLKVLGATSRDIARIYLMQIAAAALCGIGAGLIVGIAVVPVLSGALGDLLPVRTGLVIDPMALIRAALFGLLIALIFAAPPLAVARRFPAMALMRAVVAPPGGSLRLAWRPVAGGLAAIVALALAGAQQPILVAGFLAGALALFGLLAGLGLAIKAGAARLPRPRSPLLRMALGNLHRPGAQTPALVTALGFGLTTFVLLAAIQTSLSANIAARVPQRAPDYFVLDVPRDQVTAFRAEVAARDPGASVRTVPALRGAILAYGPQDAMIRVADLKEIPDDAWALRGERGLTYADALPPGNALTAGRWWPVGYAGPPLVSVDQRLADAVGLKLGDMITISLLGVERSARIASFRRIDWDSLGFNYVLVFSPNAIADAPHNLAATIDLPVGAPTGPLLQALVKRFPSSSVIEVGGVLRQAQALLGQVSAAILSAASVAVLAGLAVLLGAIAAARSGRVYDSVILRVLGASRRQILLLQISEYALLAGILALVALGLGCGVAWLVVVKQFGFAWLPHWPTVLGVLGAGVALVLGFALAASLPVLRARPAQALREL